MSSWRMLGMCIVLSILSDQLLAGFGWAWREKGKVSVIKCSGLGVEILITNGMKINIELWEKAWQKLQVTSYTDI